MSASSPSQLRCQAELKHVMQVECVSNGCLGFRGQGCVSACKRTKLGCLHLRCKRWAIRFSQMDVVGAPNQSDKILRSSHIEFVPVRSQGYRSGVTQPVPSLQATCLFDTVSAKACSCHIHSPQDRTSCNCIFARKQATVITQHDLISISFQLKD